MKYTLILLFFVSISSFAQIRGSIVLGGDFSNSQFNEYPHLKDIADIQKEITRYQSAIAIEQASMVVLEEKLYKGISKKENFIGGPH